MTKRKIRYCAAKNFLCFGPSGIEVHFDDFGPIVLVRGKNLDYANGDPEDSSNGTGKSSIQDIIAYALFGKTIKEPRKLDHGRVINSITGKNLWVELHLDDYRIVRRRKPDHLQLWHSADQLWDDESEITKGTVAETQKIIDKIIGLNHQSFCNVAVFDDTNSYAFLELDTEGKRNVTENLLGLDRYREHHENAKSLLKSVKKTIVECSQEYDRSVRELEKRQEYLDDLLTKDQNWKNSKRLKIDEFTAEIKSKEQSLLTFNQEQQHLDYKKVQLRMAALDAELAALRRKKDDIASATKKGMDKLNDVTLEQNTIRISLQNTLAEAKAIANEHTSISKAIAELENMIPGQRCTTCHGVVDPKNYGSMITHERNKLDRLKSEIEKKNADCDQKTNSYTLKKSFADKLKTHIDDAKQKSDVLTNEIHAREAELNKLQQIKPPQPDAELILLENDITTLKRRVNELLEELNCSPYEDIIVRSRSDLQHADDYKKQCEASLHDVEEEVKYCEFWVKAFSDTGIRRNIINGVIPALNDRVAYWLRHLIEAKIDVVFDCDLKETITRNGTPATYHAMSNGEKRRINLAVSQAFAHVMMLNCGSCPSLIFFDEITGGSIDKAGIAGIYNMIFEIAKHRQVFLTTHNQILLDLMSGCEEITLIKENDFSTIAGRINN